MWSSRFLYCLSNTCEVGVTCLISTLSWTYRIVFMMVFCNSQQKFLRHFFAMIQALRWALGIQGTRCTGPGSLQTLQPKGQTDLTAEKTSLRNVLTAMKRRIKIMICFRKQEGMEIKRHLSLSYGQVTVGPRLLRFLSAQNFALNF